RALWRFLTAAGGGGHPQQLVPGTPRDGLRRQRRRRRAAEPDRSPQSPGIWTGAFSQVLIDGRLTVAIGPATETPPVNRSSTLAVKRCMRASAPGPAKLSSA